MLRLLLRHFRFSSFFFFVEVWGMSVFKGSPIPNSGGSRIRLTRAVR